MERPEHLQPVEDASIAVWIAKRKLAFAAGVLGLLSFIVVAIGSPEITAVSDLRLALPGFLLTIGACVASLIKREPQGYYLWALGLALAGIALVLGWFLMIAIIAAAAALLIVILHALM